MKKEAPLVEVTGEENPSIVDTPTDLLIEEAEIFKKLDIPWIPDDEQDLSTDKPFESDRENLQKTVRQYKQQMSYMQEVNDGLMMANKRLREDLQDVNDHFQELTIVAKEALKRKRATNMHCIELERTIQDLEQRNKELVKKINDMEQEQKKAKRKDQPLDGIALLAEAAKKL